MINRKAIYKGLKATIYHSGDTSERIDITLNNKKVLMSFNEEVSVDMAISHISKISTEIKKYNSFKNAIDDGKFKIVRSDYVEIGHLKLINFGNFFSLLVLS